MILLTATGGRRTANRESLPALLTDLDDTLIDTQPLYDQAETDAANVVAAAGLNPERFRVIFKERELANTAVHGLSPVRLPLSARQAYIQLAQESHRQVFGDIADRVEFEAKSVFRNVAPVVHGAAEMLSQVRKNRRIMVVTHGDITIQNKRLDDSGLRGLLDDVFIVPLKTAQVLDKILTEQNVDRTTAWFLGNSVASDMNPAVACGIGAIWKDVPSWAWEERETLVDASAVVRVTDLSQVASIIGVGRQQGFQTGR